MFKFVAGLVLTAVVTTFPGQAARSVQDTGQFEYRVARIDMHNRVSGVDSNTWTGADIGFEIKNTGSAPVQVAIVHINTKIQVDGGIGFDLDNNSVSGISVCRGTTVQECQRNYPDFTLLRQGRTLTGTLRFTARISARDIGRVKFGRLSGVLFVRETEDGKSWMEPFTLADIEVVTNFR